MTYYVFYAIVNLNNLIFKKINMERLDNFKLAVREIFENNEMKTDSNDPILFLYSIDCFLSKEAKEVMIGGININTGSCFAKMLKAAVLIEQLFPNHLIYSGLVCENLFRNLLLGRRFDVKYWNDNYYIEEILQHEESRLILIDEKGNHFDPLFKSISYYPETLTHPLVEVYDLWEGLHAFYLIISAIEARKKNNLNQYCKLLFRANSLYSCNSLVKEALARLHSIFSHTVKAVSLIDEITRNHKNAKRLFYLWEVTGDVFYKNSIIDNYNIAMFYYLDNLYVKPSQLTPVMHKSYDSLSEIEKDDFLKEQIKPIKIFDNKVGAYCSPYISENN